MQKKEFKKKRAHTKHPANKTFPSTAVADISFGIKSLIKDQT